jgi:hypothetical protein
MEKWSEQDVQKWLYAAKLATVTHPPECETRKTEYGIYSHGVGLEGWVSIVKDDIGWNLRVSQDYGSGENSADIHLDDTGLRMLLQVIQQRLGD